MCRFSKLLLFSFFFCKDGSDRLMKRASYSCCNFLCIVLAAAYLKYRLCRLSCLPFVWHPFFIVTHTHSHTLCVPGSRRDGTRSQAGLALVSCIPFDIGHFSEKIKIKIKKKKGYGQQALKSLLFTRYKAEQPSAKLFSFLCVHKW